MLAAHFGTYNTPYTMADDSMEISSEHGHNLGDHDIDIDIDFTVGQVDEEMIEDIAPNVDIENEQLQPSPAATNDMVIDGDDDGSYQMEDADLYPIEEGRSVEPEPMFFAATEDIDFSEAHAETAGLGTNESIYYGMSQEERDDLKNEIKADLHLGDSEDSEDANLRSSVEQRLLEVEEVPVEESPNGLTEVTSGASTPHHHSPSAPEVVEVEALRSPPASIRELDPHSPQHKVRDSEANPISTLDALKNVDPLESTPPHDSNEVVVAHGVMVIYKSIEYTLFSTSDSDDPDSYFFTDRTILEKPLSEFFAAIRNVIHEDLTDEDELCISVEDLGLETEEGSCASISWIPCGNTSPVDVTLANIVELHERLLQNDGVPLPRPLCLVLGTRTNFSKRLTNLSSGAGQGKSLSELITWDDQSDSPVDSGEADESKHDLDTNVESYTIQEFAETETVEEQVGEAAELKGDEGADATQRDNHESPLPEEPASAELDITGTEHDDTQNAAPKTETEQLGLSTDNNNESVDGSGIDEDGDLIDYSDDEIETSSRHKDEPERDHSEAVNGDVQDNPDQINDADYDDNVEEEIEHSIPEGDPLDSKDDEFDAHNHGDDLTKDLGVTEEARDDGENQPGTDFNVYENGYADEESRPNQGDEYVSKESVNYSIDTSEMLQVFPSGENGYPTETTQGSGTDNASALVDVSGGSNTFPEAAESSATASGDEISYEDELGEEVFDNSNAASENLTSGQTTNEDINVGDEDEIDYEDDEDEGEKEQEPFGLDANPLLATRDSPAGNVKRSRAELESDDGFSAENKDAKRSRS